MIYERYCRRCGGRGTVIYRLRKIECGCCNGSGKHLIIDGDIFACRFLPEGDA